MAIVALITGVVIIILLFSFYFADITLKPKRRPKVKTPVHYGLPYENILFKSEGRSLHGWVIKQPDTRSKEKIPIVILVHGWEASAQAMLPHAQYLYRAGFNLFLFDMRGHGDSEDMDYVSLVRFTEDIHSALEYLRTREDVDTDRLALFGHSMGAAAAIVSASRNPSIKAVVASSTFAFFDMMARDMLSARHLPYFPFGHLLMLFWNRKLKIPISDWSPGRNVGNIRSPILIAHGTRDEVLSMKHFESLWKNASPEFRQRIVIGNGRHRNLYEFPEYRAAVVSFLREHFIAQTPSPVSSQSRTGDDRDLSWTMEDIEKDLRLI
jgi:pimeloyl-ACP methyl ester carboxylesterase